jgi:hypothetical protein
MKKDLILRVENLLLIVPAIAGYLFALSFPENYCNVLLFDSHFLISHIEATIAWMIVLMIPFIMHYVLRAYKKDNIIIASLHVALTLIIVLVFPFLYNSAPLILDQWHHLTLPPPMYDYWQKITRIADVLWIMLGTIQIAFFVYGFIVLFKKDNEIVF